jgi:hypothetical protein
MKEYIKYLNLFKQSDIIIYIFNKNSRLKFKYSLNVHTSENPSHDYLTGRPRK